MAIMIIRRASAIAIGCTLFAMFWGGFIVAEGDAYGNGHGGYIHSPWGILCYAAAVVLGMPGGILIERLWTNKK